MIRNRERLLTSSLLLIFSLLLSACASASTQVAIQASPVQSATASMAPSSTPDLCATNNIKKEIKRVYDLMQKFDDTVFIASLTSQQQLPHQGVPNNLAWIFTNIVTLNVDISKVPVISPALTATATPAS